jgi:hypothetical protein
MLLPSAQPLQRLLPSPTSLTSQSNGNGMGNGNDSDSYGDKGGGKMMAKMAMVTATKCTLATLTKRVMATATMWLS